MTINRTAPTRAILLGLWLVATGLHGQAQTDSLRSHEIAVLARPSNDSIVLRWAPLSYRVWRSGNISGYRIERYLITRSGRLESPPVKTAFESVIRPRPEHEWEPLVKKDQYAAIAAQALFGERFEIDLQESDIFSIVNKVNENEQRFSFALFSADMSPQVAMASGLWFTDRTTKPGEKYLYRIFVNGMHGYSGSIYVSPEDEYRLPEPPNLKGEFRDRTVSLRWDKLPATPYSAFLVERSSNGQQFMKVSDIPVITLASENRTHQRYQFAADSLPDNSTTYYYRVKGITPFGEEGPASDVVSGNGVYEVERVPYITSVETSDNQTMSLKWDFPETSNTAIRGFHVERSSGPNEMFQTLTPQPISPFEREHIDQSPLPVNYYRVKALGLDGEVYLSHPYFAHLVDSIPPHVPKGLHAVAEKNGQIRLSWTPNSDGDIYGYRVYRSWLRSEECAQITIAPVRTHEFTDHVNLHTLNDSVYYRIMAIDVNQNHSTLSTILGISLPDTIRPQAPVILPSQVDTTGVFLSWMAGGSTDIVAYEVYRSNSSASGWVSVARIASGIDSVYTFVDVDCPAERHLYYTVVSIDDAGLESDPASPVNRTCFPARLPSAVTWHKPKITRDQNTVRLLWEYDRAPIISFKIFRSVNDLPPTLLTTVDATQNEFIDAIIPGNMYAYRILASFRNGRNSALSDELKFKY